MSLPDSDKHIVNKEQPAPISPDDLPLSINELGLGRIHHRDRYRLLLKIAREELAEGRLLTVDNLLNKTGLKRPTVENFLERLPAHLMPPKRSNHIHYRPPPKQAPS